MAIYTVQQQDWRGNVLLPQRAKTADIADWSEGAAAAGVQVSAPVAAALGLGAQAADLERALGALSPWRLLASYTQAGEFTFVAPDLLNGAPYVLGVYLMGGGGGGVSVSPSDTELGRTASGGAAGYGGNALVTVTPGQTITGTIGEGGAPAALTNPDGGTVTGGTGGATSFGTVTALGGAGGRGNAFVSGTPGSSSNGAHGGQGSHAYFMGEGLPLPCGCQPTMDSGGSPITHGGMSQSPRVGQNQFDPHMVSLCAGGNGRESGLSPCTTGQGGLGAGPTAGQNGQNATGNGNGGGSTLSHGYVGGAGSPGAVYLYVRHTEAG